MQVEKTSSPRKQIRVVARASVLELESALHVPEEFARLANVLRVVILGHHRERVWVLQVKVGTWYGLGMALCDVLGRVPKFNQLILRGQVILNNGFCLLYLNTRVSIY